MYRMTPKTVNWLEETLQWERIGQMDEHAKRQYAQECKELGNSDFRKREFYDAIGNYSKGLSICPDDIDLLSNRGFASLQFECYNTALLDIEAVLKVNPEHEKCLYRKIKALCGLRRYEEALSFALGLQNEIKAKPDFEALIPKCRELVEQSKGHFTMEDVLKLRDLKEPVAEYTGPVKIGEIQGKGRGVIATSDIKPGQLIICSKAFVYGLEEDAKRKFGQKLDAGGVSVHISNTMDYCLAIICRKLSLDPSLRKSFFDMYAGPTAEIPESAKTKTTEIESDDATSAIYILEYNVTDTRGKTPSGGSVGLAGLWTLPSYLNHSCMDCNAAVIHAGVFSLVRAMKPIKKGEEVTIFKIPPTNPIRREFIRTRNLKCNCSLCRMEDSENSMIREKVDKTLNLIRTGLDTADLRTQVTRIRKLISLRRNYPKTNLALLDDSVKIVCWKLNQKKDYKTFVEIYAKVHEVALDNCSTVNKVDIAQALIESFVALGDKPNSMKWIRKLKQSLVNTHGTVRAGKHLTSGLHCKLKTKFGIDFFEEDE